MKQLIFVIFTILNFNVQAEEFSGNDGIPYLDSEFSCTSAADADRYIRDFGIDVESFGGRELCNSNVDTKKLLNDIEIIEKGKFDADGSNKFVRGFVNVNSYYQWAVKETYGIKRGQDLPWATAYNSGGYFTMQDGWAKLSTLGRVGTFIHEARHTAGYMHIRCNQGPYQGASTSGCDRDYNYGGSHAVEMEYYARVAVQGKNFHPVYKKMARLMAIARSNIFFNTPILQTREAVMALTSDKAEAHIFDKGEMIQREVPAADGRLKRSSFGGVLFDGIKALAIELYENSGFSDPVPDTYSYFKLLGEAKTGVKDMEEFDVGTKRYLVKVSQQNKLALYDFPSGRWGVEINLNFDFAKFVTSVPGRVKPGLFLVAKNGEIYNFQPENSNLTRLGQNWTEEFQDVIVFGGQNLILSREGLIGVLKDGRIEPWNQNQYRYSSLIAVPMYDGFEVVKK